MTRVYFTIDTEYSAGIARRLGAGGRAENFARSIACITPAGAVGVAHQCAVFARHGLRAVFFVDPMPALLWGVEAISDVIAPVLSAGHDVQLHLHSEWLELAGTANPLGTRTGGNLKDFGFEEQCQLIDYARSVLQAAGAPAPIAFRAGNYGANDDTLRALAALGMRYDSSHCPGYPGSACAIGLGAADRAPVRRHGVVEMPVSSIAARGGGQRHAQLTALTAREMLAAIRHAARHAVPDFTLVSHSFELLSRDRQRINTIVSRRFERLCAGLATLAGARTATYRDDPPAPGAAGSAPPLLPHRWTRTLHRFGEQALANARYGAR